MERNRVLIRTLPVQTTGNLIIVGDIHGCLEEFDNLLKEVNFRQGTDVLVHVGDLVNKGKDSKGVVTRCIEIGAIGVMGNHDDTLLECYKQQLKTPFTKEDLRDPVKRVAKYLGAKCAAYLESLPHVLRIPQYNLIVVHAGINPYLRLEEQIPDDLVTMRRIMADGRAVAKGSIDGTMWAKVWAGPETIVFGHDAKTGLQEEPFALGLDTGCVYGRELTAVVYPGRKLVAVPGASVQTRAKVGQEDKPLSLSVPIANGFVSDEQLMTPSMVRAGSRSGQTPPMMLTSSGTFGSPPPSFPSVPISSSGGAGTGNTPTVANTPGSGMTHEPSVFIVPKTPSQPAPSLFDTEGLKGVLFETRIQALRVVLDTKNVDALLSLLHPEGVFYKQGWNELIYDTNVPLDLWKDVVWLLAKNVGATQDEKKQTEMLHHIQDVLLERDDVTENLCFLLRAQLQADQVSGKIRAEKPFKALLLILRPS